MGLEAAGMTTAFQCELDAHCQQVLQHHWPDVPKWDDVSTLTGAHVLEMTGGVDVVAWGSPCQDLSVAGRRAGLAGDRSGLFHEGIRIIKEMQRLSGGKFPTWSIWENVVGALSSNGGADFGQVLYEMDEAGACFSEWAVLDAQYFGVPQRRRRVFLVSCFNFATSERSGDKVLSVEPGSSGDFEARSKKKQVRSAEALDRPTGNGRGFRMLGFGHYADDDTASALKQRDYKDATDLIVHESPILIDRAAFNQGENALYVPYISDDPVSPSIVARGPHATFSQNQLRRLTCVESERLMGWPDNHTLFRADGKTNNETNRYKMCGNGVASPVAQWIGEQIVAIGV